LFSFATISFSTTLLHLLVLYFLSPHLYYMPSPS